MLSGTEDCERLLTMTSSGAPFIRRYCYNATLDYFKYCEHVNSEYYLTLRGLDQQLYDLAELSGEVHLHDLSIMVPLYVATTGNLEYLRQIIYEALKIALLREPVILQRIDFIDACNTLWLPINLATHANPFNLSIAESLDLIGKHLDEQAYLRAHSAH